MAKVVQLATTTWQEPCQIRS